MTAQTYPSVINYSGRQVDLELLQSVITPTVTPQRVNVALVTRTPKIVTGVEKLVQRYTLTLLSYMGSVHFDQRFGTNLLAQIISGQIQDKGQLLSLFGLANIAVLTNLSLDDSKVTTFGPIPDDEILISSTVKDVNIDFVTATVFLTVLLTTQAGTSMTFVIPTTTPR